MASESTSVPLARPPRQVGLVVFEFSGQEDGDEHLVDGTLDVNDANKTEDRVRNIPQLQEPL